MDEEEEEEQAREDTPDPGTSALKPPSPSQADVFSGLPPLTERGRKLLLRAIFIGQGSDRKSNEPYADWKSLLAAFAIDDDRHDDTQLTRWFARTGLLRVDVLIPLVLGDAKAQARERIRIGTLPPAPSDGWFTQSVRGVLMRAASLGADSEIAPHHILAAMILPQDNPHADDLRRATEGNAANPTGSKLEELRRLTRIEVSEIADSFRMMEVGLVAPGLIEPVTRGPVDLVGRFMASCATLGAEDSPFAGFQRPYVAAVHLIRSGECDGFPRLKAFLEAEAAGWMIPLHQLESALNSKRSAAQIGQGARVVERARRIARATSRTAMPDMRHIVAALYAVSDALPPRAQYLTRNESIETLEALVAAVQATEGDTPDGGERRRENAAWAQMILGPAKRVPAVRDMGERDLIDFDRFARAFAQLIADRAMTPPLAIGVFGAWGAGKSMFMGLVEKHVRSFANRAVLHGSDGFCQGVVQIRFNAWHYSDVNLWASIVSHIFTELDTWLTKRAGTDATAQMLNRLGTARELTLDATRSYVARRAEQLDAKRRLDTAERELKAARDQLRLSPADIAGVVRETFAKEFDNTADAAGATARALGLDQLKDRPEELLAAVDNLSAQVARGRGLGQALLRHLGGGWRLAAFLAALLLVPFALTWLQHWIALAPGWSWLRDISASVIAAAGFIATAAAAITRLSARIVPALDRVSMIKDRLDRAITARQVALGSDKGAVADIVAADAAAERARTAFDAANKRLAEEYAEFTATSGAQRLRRLVRDRASEDGTYARHLGLISTIQKDFEQLAQLLKPGQDAGGSDSRRVAYEHAVRSLVREAGFDDTAEGMPQPSAAFRSFASAALPPIAAERLISDDEARAILRTTEPLRDADAAAGATIERIVLYVDDLDRCRPNMVMQVLEAIHILLASDLFVVVVGVDMRWLLASIEKSHTQLSAAGGPGEALDFLEKIFQIPFWVPAMTQAMRADVIREALPRAPAAAATPPRPADSATGAPAALEAASPTPAVPAPAPAPDGGIPPPLPPPGLLTISSSETAALVEAAQIAGNTPRRLKRLARSYLLLRASMQDEESELLERYEHTTRAIAFLLAAASGAPRGWPALRQALLAAEDDRPLRELFAEFGFTLDAKTTPPSVAACRGWADAVSQFVFVPFQPTLAAGAEIAAGQDTSA